MKNERHSIVGLGAGGHCKVILDIVRNDPGHLVVGLLDSDETLHGTEKMGVKVLGDDSKLADLVADGVTHFFVGVGHMGNASVRTKLFDKAVVAGLTPLSVIHNAAVVSPVATLGKGVVLMANAVVNAEAVIGDNVIINTGAIVEHDCRIADQAHIATGARLAGNVHVGVGAFVGAGSVIREGITIGDHATIGMGSVVVRDVAPRDMVMGNPARSENDAL